VYQFNDHGSSGSRQRQGSLAKARNSMLLFSCNSDILPSIDQILSSFYVLTKDGTLLQHCVASLFRVTVGFYLAVVLSIPIGIFLGRSKPVYRVLNPVIQFLRPISPLAWAPFAILWFGIGDLPAIFIIFLASFFPLLISAVTATASIHPMYFQVAANLQLTRWNSFRNIILPAIIPNIILVLRVTMGMAWVVVVAAEMIAVKSGLGFLIIDGRNALRMDRIVVSIVAIGTIGLILDHVMQRLERIESARWKLEQK
jgi:NitT/TauT family transport system permease protein